MTARSEQHLLEEKRAIIQAALPHVIFDGWSEKTLKAASLDAGFEETMHIRCFQNGVRDAIVFYLKEADRTMEEAVMANEAVPAMRIHERISYAVKTRIEQHASSPEAIRAAVGFLAVPSHAPDSLKTLYHTVDSIWWAIGDQSVDFSFYTKRATLAGVYSTTLLVWLDDTSEDKADTWAFLDRRIANVMGFHKTKAKVEKTLSKIPTPFKAVKAACAAAKRVKGAATLKV